MWLQIDNAAEQIVMGKYFIEGNIEVTSVNP